MNHSEPETVEILVKTQHYELLTTAKSVRLRPADRPPAAIPAVDGGEVRGG